MDFNLNLQPTPGFETPLDSEFFQWNVDYERISDTEHGRGSCFLSSDEKEDDDVDHGIGQDDVGGEDSYKIGNDDVDHLFGNVGTNDDEAENAEFISDEEEHAEVIQDIESTILLFEERLAPGSLVDCMDDAYLLYREYGKHKGFSVRKSGQKLRYKTTIIYQKDYKCSCEGTSSAKQLTDRLNDYKKQDNRCNCPAMLRVKARVDGKWCVTKFVKEHNHELVDQDHTYLLRSCRDLSQEKKYVLELLHKSGIKVKDAFRFMENEAGGPGNAGFIRKDAYHHMEKLRRKTKADDTDDEGRVMNFFFRDSRSLLDFECFGDVVTFDTTYKTKKYELVCAPFVGVNHHMKNCLFGLAFLSDETTATFEWLFSCFLESMGGKEPDVILSDQCLAIMNAVDTIFKSTKHRLCQWHINKNAPSYFGSLNGNKAFKDEWYSCMKGCETVDEFEETWRKMVEDYNLGDVRWFGTMYELRSRWSNAFGRDKFCAGLNATSRSEVTNKVLKDISQSSGSLHAFVLQYEQVQLEWRRTEGVDDTASMGVPGLFVKDNPLLMQAARFCTRRVFNSFEYEGTHSINVDILHGNRHGGDSNVIEYELKDNSRCPKRIRRVTYNNLTNEVSCSCCMWQRLGVLCAHIFKVYYFHNVKTIPTTYLMRRVSKDAKRRRATDILSGCQSTSTDEKRAGDTAFKNHVMRTTYDMIHDISMDVVMRAHLLKKLDEVKDELLVMAKGGTTNTGPNPPRRRPQNTYKNDAQMPPCRDPVLPAKRRFTNTRLSNHWETSTRKGKKRPDVDSGARVFPPIRRMQRGASTSHTGLHTNS